MHTDYYIYIVRTVYKIGDTIETHAYTIEDVMLAWSIYKKCRTSNVQFTHQDLSNEKAVFMQESNQEMFKVKFAIWNFTQLTQNVGTSTK